MLKVIFIVKKVGLAGGTVWALTWGSQRTIISSDDYTITFWEVYLVLATAEKLGVGLKAKLFRGFSDPSRLSILEALRAGPLTVTEIVAVTGLNQPNASSHLGCLRDCGLVSAEQQGRYVRYQLSDRRVATLLRVAEELLADVAKGVYECTRYRLREDG